MTPRMIVINGSGAWNRRRQQLWLAEASGRGLARLECGRDLQAIVDHLIAEATRTTDLVVGIDFGASLGELSLAELGLIEPARDASRHLNWWGEAQQERRSRSAVLDFIPEWMGTSSLQDARMLERLNEAGFATWPSDLPTMPRVIEISARALEGALTAAYDPAWEDYLKELCPTLDPDLAQRASGSEYARDAAISALIMARHAMEFACRPSDSYRSGHLDGGIWLPTLSPRAKDDDDASELLAYGDPKPSWPPTDPQVSGTRARRAIPGNSAEYDADRWEEVVSSILPAPVRMSEPGIIIGGDPGEVVACISPERITILEFGVRWFGHTPVADHVPVAAFPLHGTRPDVVARVIIQARSNRLRSYGWCACCRELNPPEWMHDRATCQGCAEMRLGIVY